MNKTADNTELLKIYYRQSLILGREIINLDKKFKKLQNKINKFRKVLK